MTCEHCVSAVLAELAALDGVSDVWVDVTAGGRSSLTVTCTPPVNDAQVAAGLDEAGDYRPVGTHT